MQIRIRRYREADVEPLYHAVVESRDHLSPWLPWCHPGYTIADTQSWVMSSLDAWQQGTAYRFIIECRSSGRLLGAVGIERIVKSHKIGELGYWVSQSALKQGVGKTAARLAATKAFTELDINRLDINVLPNNTPSNAVARSINAKFEGTLRNKLFHNGRSHAANCYSLIPEDCNIKGRT